MGSNPDDFHLFNSTIQTLERLHLEIVELFGENSQNDGLIAKRLEYLHQFTLIAATLHQENTTKWLRSKKGPLRIFEDEINLAHQRSILIQNDTLTEIQSLLTTLDLFMERISKNKILIDQFLYILSRLERNNSNKEIYDLEKIFSHQKNKQEILFSLEEIRSQILEPAISILQLEINAGNKILDYFDTEANNDILTPEEIARICEVTSWGFETNINWEDIQSYTQEFSEKIRQEVQSMKNQLNIFQSNPKSNSKIKSHSN